MLQAVLRAPPGCGKRPETLSALPRGNSPPSGHPTPVPLKVPSKHFPVGSAARARVLSLPRSARQDLLARGHPCSTEETEAGLGGLLAALQETSPPPRGGPRGLLEEGGSRRLSWGSSGIGSPLLPARVCCPSQGRRPLFQRCVRSKEGPSPAGCPGLV